VVVLTLILKARLYNFTIVIIKVLNVTEDTPTVAKNETDNYTHLSALSEQVPHINEHLKQLP